LAYGQPAFCSWLRHVRERPRPPLNGPNAGRTTGTVNPGVIWVSRYPQVGVEAIIPINIQSGRDLGVRAQAHLYLPAIFPGLKPMFGN
jgi:hypothetical protein